MNQLPIFVNLRGRTVILLGEGEMADAKRRLYARAGAVIISDEHAADAALAVVAIEDEAEAVAATRRLKKRGLLVNAVDRSVLCDYTTPAIIDRDPVLIAIGTGGASAGLAKALRQRLEKLMPSRLGRLAQSLLAARDRMKDIFPGSSERRRAIDAALDPGGPLDPFADHCEDAVELWLDNPGSSAETGVVELTLSSGDPDDLTIRQARLMGQADVIFADTDVPETVLVRARADAEMEPMEKFDRGAVSGLCLLIRMPS